MFSAMAGNGALHVIEPTARAAGIPSASTEYRSAPGAFTLVSLDIATGQLIDTVRLPAFYGGPGQVVVSVESPPGVVAVTGSDTIVSPQFRETDTAEAFDD